MKRLRLNPTAEPFILLTRHHNNQVAENFLNSSKNASVAVKKVYRKIDILEIISTLEHFFKAKSELHITLNKIWKIQ